MSSKLIFPNESLFNRCYQDIRFFIASGLYKLSNKPRPLRYKKGHRLRGKEFSGIRPTFISIDDLDDRNPPNA